MKTSPNRNPEEEKRNPVYCAAQEVWDEFGEHLSGLLSGPVCVVSKCTLNNAAQNALTASANRLGYGERAITFLTLESPDAAAGNTTAQLAVDSTTTQLIAGNTTAQLTTEGIFKIIEGIDPYAIIATDATSLNALSHAYNAEFTSRSPARLFGRNAVGFVDFESMLEKQEDKRAAWEHLKLLGEHPHPQ